MGYKIKINFSTFFACLKIVGLNMPGIQHMEYYPALAVVSALSRSMIRDQG